MYKPYVFSILVICLFFGSCISAGPTVVCCYSKLNLNEEDTIELLNKFWENHPENRIDDFIIKKLEKNTPLKTGNIFFKDSLGSKSVRYIFRFDNSGKDYKKTFWWIKSSDGKMLFEIFIGNKGELANGFNADLCLKSVLFIDNASLNFRNWQLTSEERKVAKKVFENDILNKLKESK